MMRLLKNELEKIYDDFSQQLFVCALAVTGNKELAEDAMHNAFCHLFHLNFVPQNLKAYVFKSVRNSAIDLIRQNGRTILFSENYIFDSENSHNPREIANRNQFQYKVSQALLKLSEDEREVIVQHLYADLTFREIAELLNISIGTVTSWYHRGLERLKKLLEE